MGSSTSTSIRVWQESVGIEPVTGRRAEILKRMREGAAELIRIVALEESGIRDGDGGWYGCFPLAEVVFQLGDLLAAYEGRPTRWMSADDKKVPLPDNPNPIPF